MKFVLADIRNKKICGLYGGRNEKYGDMWNYVGSADYRNCGYKFNSIEEAIRIKTRLTKQEIFVRILKSLLLNKCGIIGGN